MERKSSDKLKNIHKMFSKTTEAKVAHVGIKKKGGKAKCFIH